jgi:iron complex transport system permease protein
MDINTDFIYLRTNRFAFELFSIKPLNALLLGENYARSLGLNYKKSRLIIIFTPVFLAGSITAFAGIAFIGLAVPHKLVFPNK